MSVYYSYLIFLICLIPITGCQIDNRIQGQFGDSSTAPNISSVVLNYNANSFYKKKSPTLTWNSANETRNPISHYEIAVGTSSGALIY